MTETEGSLESKKTMFRNRLRDLIQEFQYLDLPEGEACAMVKACYQQEDNHEH